MSSIEMIDRSNIDDILGLSSLQKGILFYYLNNPCSKIYMARLALSICGDVDIGLLQKACKLVTDNNEMLRAVFRWEGLSNPVQIVLKEYEIPFHIYDFSHNPDTGIEEQIAGLKEKDWDEKIDISRHPIEITVCKLNHYSCEIIIRWNHIVYDGWSNAIFIRELLSTYDSLKKKITPETTKKKPYKEFIKWCMQQDEKAQESFWKTYFKDFAVKNPIPVDVDKKADMPPQDGSYCFALPEDLLINISGFTSKKGMTLAALMYCAWAILLYKYSGVSDIVFGITVSGRNAGIEGIENIMGLFINTLPLRVTIDEKTKIADILEEIGQRQKSLIPYEITGLVKIKTCSGVDAREALFDSVVVVENYPLMMDRWLSGDGAEMAVKSFEMLEKTEFSLVLAVLLPHNNTLILQYDTQQFSAGFVEKMTEYYLHILSTIITDFDKPVSEVELLLEKEKEKMLLEIRNLQGSIDINFDL